MGAEWKKFCICVNRVDFEAIEVMLSIFLLRYSFRYTLFELQGCSRVDLWRGRSNAHFPLFAAETWVVTALRKACFAGPPPPRSAASHVFGCEHVSLTR